MDTAVARKRCPAEDRGNLSSDEFGFFALLLAVAVAVDETTRNAISHGTQAFLAHPDQWELSRRHRPLATATGSGNPTGPGGAPGTGTLPRTSERACGGHTPPRPES